VTLEEFERLAALVIRGLPLSFREKMQNVVVIAAEAPTPAQRKRFGPGLQGLYEGVPLLERASYYSGAMPDKITLFRKNIESGCSGEKELAARVRHVVLHEVAHYFGITDEELRRKGLY
jgi:predicted Zn-dependent protease with MMP-like domain